MSTQIAVAGSSSIEETYVERSLSHERRMLEIYRRDSERDASLVQPLANACRRAAAFVWTMQKDARATRELWAEAARALAGGWTTRREGFDPSPHQLILALHLSIAARERDAFTNLARLSPAARLGAMRDSEAFRGARGLIDLAEGYALTACALVERDPGIIRPAREMLTSARLASERRWWQLQFVDPLEAAWRFREHEATCAMLSVIAEQIAVCNDSRAPTAIEAINAEPERRAAEFVALLDEALGDLHDFVSRATDHHPKLYVWLPGVALYRLASSAGLPLDESLIRSSDASRYERLPAELL